MGGAGRISSPPGGVIGPKGYGLRAEVWTAGAPAMAGSGAPGDLIFTSPVSIAYRTSRAVSWMSSFCMRFVRCVLMVRMLRKRVSAIFRFVRPWAMY